MSADREALARRAAVAWEECGLGWMPGMHARSIFDEAHEDYTPPGVVISVVSVAPRIPPTCGVALDIGHDDGTQGEQADGMLPDMDHPATLGCIEHGMLPAAWSGCSIRLARWNAGDAPPLADVEVFDRDGQLIWSRYSTPLAEGLVACLEAAAERREP